LSRVPTLELRIGHRFADRALLEQALTHRSSGSPHNERLEFLGDGVLDCAVAEDLFRRHPQLDEGTLTRVRASLVRQATLAAVAREIGLAGFLRVGGGSAASGDATRDSVLADALEALYGAVFLDGGYAAAQGVIQRTYGDRLQAAGASGPDKDAKTRLQETLQARRLGLPVYRLLATQGAAHARRFEVECSAADLGVAATGAGNSRRAAEQEAAAALLLRLPAGAAAR
jgi:ribonuclease-3